MREALEAVAPTLREIAAECGFSYGTLRAWKAGIRNPSPSQLDKLADALERRGGRLAELAGDLRAEAKGGDDGEG